MFDPTACHVTRTSDHDYLVTWHSVHPGQKVAIYMADTPERFYAGEDPGAPVGEFTGEMALIRNPDTSVRHYFYLLSEHGEGVILAERRLPLEGAHNFRDLGGYEAHEGRRLRWGKLYRSSKLSQLTEADQGYFRRLGVTLICDFRQALEAQLEPSLFSGDVQHVIAHLPVTPGSSQNFIENLHQGIVEVHDAAGFMQEINRDFVASQLPRYAEMFQLILDKDQPMLIHCASGKDRTGFGAALILDVLGVNEKTIVEDYLLTNRYLPIDAEVERLSGQFRDRTGAGISKEVLRPMLEVRPEYLMACFEEIRKHYASKEHFWETALDLDEQKIAALRKRYLH